MGSSNLIVTKSVSMSTKSMNRVDPSEWANKRKAQLEKAKQLREERKSGIAGEHSFAPQVNKRPGYLDANKPTQPEPSINNRPDDPMEQPLPGSRKNNTSNDIFEQPLPGNKGSHQISNSQLPISPNSDALGKEVRKYNNNGQPPNGIASSHGSLPSSSSQYKSKFMQQIDEAEVAVSQSTRGGHPPRQNQAPSKRANNEAAVRKSSRGEDEVEADLFASQLRGGDGADSGWNNDTSVPSTFAEVKRAAPRRSRPQQSSSGVQNENDASNKNQGAGQGNAGSRSQVKEFNFDVLHDQQQQQQNSNSSAFRTKISPRAPWDNTVVGPSVPRVSPRQDSLFIAGGGGGAGGSSKSRLSLLKSKMRKSESGGAERGAADGEFLPSSHPKTAPMEEKGKSDALEMEDPSGYPSRRPARNQADVSSSYDPAVEMTRQGRQPRLSKPENSIEPSQAIPSRKQAPLISAPSRRLAEASEENVVVVAPTRPKRLAVQQQQEEMRQQEQEQERERELESFRRQQQQKQQLEDSRGYENEHQGQYDNEEEYTGPLESCPDCNRSFRPDVLAKHVKVCAKVFGQKRKVFDSAKMRVQDNDELVQLLAKKAKEEKRLKKLGKVPPEEAKVAASQGKDSDWKQKSEQFRAAMKAAREYSKAVATGAPLPPPVASAPDDSLVQCPHCGRRFNAAAAERHIPQCQNIKAKPQSLKRGGGAGGGKGGSAATPKSGGGVKW